MFRIRKYHILFFLFLCKGVFGQTLSDYYPYAERERDLPMLLTDSSLFYRAIQTAPDLYDEIAGYRLPQVAWNRRGWSWQREIASLEDIKVPYRYFSMLRQLGATELYRLGAAKISGSMGMAGRIRHFGFGDDRPLRPYHSSIHFSGRNYLLGARMTAQGDLGRAWYGRAAVEARTGRDLYINGVFTDALSLGFRVEKQFSATSRLAVLAAIPISTRGTRLSATEETFTLTGDKRYNPAWGFQNGKMRNSRVRRERIPFVMVSFRSSLSPTTSLQTVVGAEVGLSSYSALGWYDARTPMPDNYRYLPSYTGDQETERVWRNGDTRYTQIDWDELIRRNRMAGGEAIYALEDRVERIANLQTGLTFETVVNRQLTLRYGVTLQYSDSRNYKEMRDLLGADFRVDIDQYLVDDDTFGNKLQNDLRHPNRKIGEGDRFGYDYALITRKMDVYAQADYRADRFRAGVAAEFGAGSIIRRGYYEKELFPNANSYGDSRRMRFTPYAFKLTAGWTFSPRHDIELSLMTVATIPEADQLFYQPLYNNRTVDNPLPERYYGAECVWRWSGERAEWQVMAYATASYDGIRTGRYYDDLAGVYCDMAIRNLATWSLGVEGAADIRLAYRWRLSLAASAGCYKYIRNPYVTVISDTDNTAVLQDAESFMGDCKIGGTPMVTGVVGLGYFAPKGWGIRLSAGYAGGRYIEAVPLRRTERMARQAGVTKTSFAAFTDQERLPDAFTVDAVLFKNFRIGNSQLSVMLMLRNLTGEDTIYNGYESLRVRRVAAGDDMFYFPHASRYTYAWPRTIYLSVGYRF